jgi:hypothetical protein
MEKMGFKSSVGIVLIMVFSAFNANASAVYTYTGNNFTSATAPYTTDMNITLQFETASALAGTGSMTNVSAEIFSYSVFDGINTLTEADSEIDVLVNIDTTTGQPTEWTIFVTNEFGKSVGDTVNRMNTVYYDYSGGTDGALEAECVFVPVVGGECMGLTNGGSAYVYNPPGSSGTWSVVPIPAAVWLFGSALIGLIGVARRKKL